MISRQNPRTGSGPPAILRPGAAGLGCVLMIALVSASPARAAGGCPERLEAAAGPLAGGTQAEQPADFGAIPEACAGSDLSLRLRGELADHGGAPDFAGDLIGSVTARARRRITERGWLSLAVDLVTYRYVNDAGLVGTGPSFGPVTLGYHRALAVTARSAVAVYARALLPLDTARESGFETGLELGASGRRRLGPRWLLDGGVSLAAPLDVTAGQGHGRLEPAALVEAWFSPRPRLALFAGGAVRAVVAPSAELLTVAPRVGVRGALRNGGWLAFLAEAPVAGNDQTQLCASLFAGWTPGP